MEARAPRSDFLHACFRANLNFKGARRKGTEALKKRKGYSHKLFTHILSTCLIPLPARPISSQALLPAGPPQPLLCQQYNVMCCLRAFRWPPGWHSSHTVLHYPSGHLCAGLTRLGAQEGKRVYTFPHPAYAVIRKLGGIGFIS